MNTPYINQNSGELVLLHGVKMFVLVVALRGVVVTEGIAGAGELLLFYSYFSNVLYDCFSILLLKLRLVMLLFFTYLRYLFIYFQFLDTSNTSA